MDINQYIEKRLDPQINWYDKKSTEAQKAYKFFQITEIVLASIIPLLTGYSNVHFFYSYYCRDIRSSYSYY